MARHKLEFPITVKPAVDPTLDALGMGAFSASVTFYELAEILVDKIKGKGVPRDATVRIQPAVLGQPHAVVIEWDG